MPTPVFSLLLIVAHADWADNFSIIGDPDELSTPPPLSGQTGAGGFSDSSLSRCHHRGLVGIMGLACERCHSKDELGCPSMGVLTRYLGLPQHRKDWTGRRVHVTE